MEIPCLILTKYASATLVMHYILIALFQPPLLRLSSIFISPSSEHNRRLEEIYKVHKKWQIQTLCQDVFNLSQIFIRKSFLSLFINYVNDYFLKCVGGNPISLLARMLVSLSISALGSSLILFLLSPLMMPTGILFSVNLGVHKNFCLKSHPWFSFTIF